MRRPEIVIRAVRDAVPAELPELRAELERLAADSWFHPPEAPGPWVALRELLEQRIGPPSLPWHFEVIGIVQSHPGQIGRRG